MNRLKLLLIVSAVALLLLTIAYIFFPLAREPKISIGPDTSVIDGPLRDDGFVDYAKALDQMASEGIEPDRNAIVALAKIMGENSTPQLSDPEFCARLGILFPAPKALIFEPDSLPGFTDYDEQFLFGQEISQVMSEPWTAEESPNGKSWLDANLRTFDALPDLLNCDQVYFPVDNLWDAMNPINNGGLRRLSWLVATRGTFLLGNADWKGAAADSINMKRMGSISGIINSHTNYISSFLEMHLQLESDLMRLADWNAVKCLNRIRELDSVLVNPPFAEQMVVRRYWDLTLLRELIKTGGVEYSEDFSGLFTATEFRFANVDEIAKAINLHHDRAKKILSIEDPQDRRDELNKFQLENDKLESQFDVGQFELITGGRTERTKALAAKVTWNLGNFSHTAYLANVKSRCQVVQGMLNVGWALKAFKYDTGEFPDKLGLLSPKYLPVVPLDAYSCKPLIYKRIDEGYKLHSTGPDLVADPVVKTSLDYSDDISITMEK